MKNNNEIWNQFLKVRMQQNYERLLNTVALKPKKTDTFLSKLQSVTTYTPFVSTSTGNTQQTIYKFKHHHITGQVFLPIYGVPRQIHHIPLYSMERLLGYYYYYYPYRRRH